MEQYNINNAIVRIHNEPNQEKIRVATEKFLKQVQVIRKKKQKEGANNHGKR